MPYTGGGVQCATEGHGAASELGALVLSGPDGVCNPSLDGNGRKGGM